MPTTPPHERLPTSGPSFASRNIAGKMSPSDDEFSFRIATIGPRNTPSGYVFGPVCRCAQKPSAEHLPAQPLDQHPRDVAAAVGADVDDQRLRAIWP